jgi:hypothetical protein
VNEDEPGGSKRLGPIDQTPRRYVATGNVALRDSLDCQQLKLCIDVQGEEPLVRLGTE